MKETNKQEIKHIKVIKKAGVRCNDELFVLLINAISLSMAGTIVPLTFFMGNFILFVLAIILFVFAALLIALRTLNVLN